MKRVILSLWLVAISLTGTYASVNIDSLLACANAGDTNAQIGVGNYYLKTKYYPSSQTDTADVLRAMDWFLKAAEQGNGMAQRRLGECYSFLGKKEEAFNWYEKSAKNGNIDGMVRLARCYKSRRNYAQALEWFQKALDEGKDAFARVELGRFYYQGLGVEVDKEKAFQYYLDNCYGNKNHAYFYMLNDNGDYHPILWSSLFVLFICISLVLVTMIKDIKQKKCFHFKHVNWSIACNILIYLVLLIFIVGEIDYGYYHWWNEMAFDFMLLFFMYALFIKCLTIFFIEVINNTSQPLRVIRPTNKPDCIIQPGEVFYGTISKILIKDNVFIPRWGGHLVINEDYTITKKSSILKLLYWITGEYEKNPSRTPKRSGKIVNWGRLEDFVFLAIAMILFSLVVQLILALLIYVGLDYVAEASDTVKYIASATMEVIVGFLVFSYCTAIVLALLCPIVLRLFGCSCVFNNSDEDIFVKPINAHEPIVVHPNERYIDVDGFKVNGVVYDLRDTVHVVVDKDNNVKCKNWFMKKRNCAILKEPKNELWQPLFDK